MNRALLVVAYLFATPAYAQYLPFEPDDKLTPGAIDPNCKLEDVQRHGYSKTVRKTSSALKAEAYRRYNVVNDPKDDFDFKIDHRIPLSLCGADTIENLWPHSYRVKPWDVHRKTRLEQRILYSVRNGRMTLGTAQDTFRGSWIEEYKFHFGMDRLPSKSASR